jgi:hypothetical protein
MFVKFNVQKYSYQAFRHVYYLTVIKKFTFLSPTLHLFITAKVKVKGKNVPVLELSTTPRKLIGEWRYSSTGS